MDIHGIEDDPEWASHVAWQARNDTLHCNTRSNANPEACPRRQTFTETCPECPRWQGTQD